MVIDDLKLKLCLNLLESLYFDEYILKSLVCSPSYTNEKKKKKEREVYVEALLTFLAHKILEVVPRHRFTCIVHFVLGSSI